MSPYVSVPLDTEYGKLMYVMYTGIFQWFPIRSLEKQQPFISVVHSQEYRKTVIAWVRVYFCDSHPGVCKSHSLHVQSYISLALVQEYRKSTHDIYTAILLWFSARNVIHTSPYIYVVPSQEYHTYISVYLCGSLPGISYIHLRIFMWLPPRSVENQ